MTKRVARFTGQSTNGSVTPFKVYDVFNEGENLFNLIDDNGNTRFCSKQCCGHICGGNWEIADVVEQTVKQDIVEEDIVTTKQPKWSKWIKNTTGKCPEGLKRKQKIKLKWSDGDKFVIDNPHDAAWCIDEGVFAVNITHYKVKLDTQPKLKEKKEWTKNTGVCPVDGEVKVEIKTKDDQKECGRAKYFSWCFDDQEWDIIKWRLAG